MKFKKRSIIFNAWKVKDFLYQPLSSLPESVADALRNGIIKCNIDPVRYEIETLEGIMTANLDDWIIQGIKGELYPCKPDIFEMLYEPYEELNENCKTLEEFIDNSFWETPEEAISDIRKWTLEHKDK